jgi:hypothetical protein
MTASQLALHCLSTISIAPPLIAIEHAPCLLTKPVENAAACLAIDGAALIPKTAGVLDAFAANLGNARGAERARCLNENIV